MLQTVHQTASGVDPETGYNYIKNRFGRDVFMVRRDMLLDTFGARQASVGDLFTGKTRWDPKVGKKFEEIAIGIIGKKAYPTSSSHDSAMA